MTVVLYVDAVFLLLFVAEATNTVFRRLSQLHHLSDTYELAKNTYEQVKIRMENEVNEAKEQQAELTWMLDAAEARQKM